MELLTLKKSGLVVKSSWVFMCQGLCISDYFHLRLFCPIPFSYNKFLPSKGNLMIIWIRKVYKIAVRKLLNKWNVNFQVSRMARIGEAGLFSFARFLD